MNVLDDCNGAIRFYLESLKICVEEDKRFILTNISLAYFKQRQYDLALKAAKEAIELDPCFFKGYLRCARVYQQRGDIEGLTHIVHECKSHCSTLSSPQVAHLDRIMSTVNPSSLAQPVPTLVTNDYTLEFIDETTLFTTFHQKVTSVDCAISPNSITITTEHSKIHHYLKDPMKVNGTTWTFNTELNALTVQLDPPPVSNPPWYTSDEMKKWTQDAR